MFVNFCYLFRSASSFVKCTFQTLHLVLAFWYVIFCWKIFFLKKNKSRVGPTQNFPISLCIRQFFCNSKTASSILTILLNNVALWLLNILYISEFLRKILCRRYRFVFKKILENFIILLYTNFLHQISSLYCFKIKSTQKYVHSSLFWCIAWHCKPSSNGTENS